MTHRVVVLGAGYAGTRAVETLERELDRVGRGSSGVAPDASSGASLTWISDRDYHLVLHEIHRVVRNPAVREHVTIPIRDVASPSTRFVEDTVTGIDTDARQVLLADREPVDYDYLLVALGSDTAFYGVPGLEEHATTLNSLQDALDIHEAVADAAADATREKPARVVIGGAGLSGIQTAGEIAEYRDEQDAHVDITLVEALDDVMPGADPGLRDTVGNLLADRDIDVLAGDPVTEADADRVFFDERDPIPYDVLVWTGGITGRDALEDATVEKNHDRIVTDETFATSDERVFAVGDAAEIDGADGTVPPTAQAAWSGAEVAAGNVIRAIEGEQLATWTFRDKGTVLSVGESAVAHDVIHVPVTTFDAAPARFLKKSIAARWIADVTSWTRALKAWSSL